MERVKTRLVSCVSCPPCRRPETDSRGSPVFGVSTLEARVPLTWIASLAFPLQIHTRNGILRISKSCHLVRCYYCHVAGINVSHNHTQWVLCLVALGRCNSSLLDLFCRSCSPYTLDATTAFLGRWCRWFLCLGWPFLFLFPALSSRLS
jgi:hypothetical protein